MTNVFYLAKSGTKYLRTVGGGLGPALSLFENATRWYTLAGIKNIFPLADKYVKVTETIQEEEVFEDSFILQNTIKGSFFWGYAADGHPLWTENKSTPSPLPRDDAEREMTTLANKRFSMNLVKI